MEIYLNRNGTGKGENDKVTIGDLIVGTTKVLTLEDDYDALKEYGHTRIPAGRYEVKLRKEGKLNSQYMIRFPKFHKGMLHITNVPGFEFIYIHIGNKADDTLGCPLVGSQKLNDEIQGSEKAYRIIYPLIANEILSGEQVFINVVD